MIPSPVSMRATAPAATVRHPGTAPVAERGQSSLAGFGLLLGGGFVTGIGASVLAAWTRFWLGAGVSGVEIWVGLAAAALFIAAGARASSGGAGQRIGLALASFTAAAVLGGGVFFAQDRFYDLSWDGLAYHADGTVAVARGWNPLRDEPVESVWVNSYPKAAWVFAGSLYKWAGDIERAKVGNLYWAIAAFGIALFTLAGVLGLSALLSLWIALLLAAHPVTMTEAFNQYADGQVAGAITCVALLTIAIRIRGFSDWRVTVPWGLAVVVAFNLKFNAALFVTLILALGGLVPSVGRSGLDFTRVLRRTRWRTYASVCVGLVLAALLAGWNPFLTNVARHGRMAWPPAETVFHGVRPPGFDSMNRFERFSRSYLARTSQQQPVLKWPFALYASEVREAAAADLPVAGFGPFWSGSLVLTAAVLLRAARRRRGHFFAAAVVMGCTLATSFATAEAYWARMAPQLWWIPVCGAALALAPGSGGWLRALGIALSIALVLNPVLFALRRWPAEAERTRALKADLARIEDYHRETGEGIYLARDYLARSEAWLYDRGVPFTRARSEDEVAFQDRIELSGAHATALLP